MTFCDLLICFFFAQSDTEIHLAQTENDLMSLSIILKSSHSTEFRLQVEDWIQLLQELGKDFQYFPPSAETEHVRIQFIDFCFPFQYL